jgi:DNA-3-methyladenine glycosylase II
MSIEPLYWQEAKQHIAHKDKVLAEIIEAYPMGSLIKSPDPFITLSRAIIGQQISVHAAENIWNRLVETVIEITPHIILNTNKELLLKAGLSKQKVLYLNNIAEHTISNPLYWQNIDIYEDHKIVEELIKLKGIGPWTIEMFLIFYKTSPDIFPIKDIGLIRAIEKLYGNGSKIEENVLKKITSAWAPYRTVATWYLWRSIDPTIISY